MALPFIIKLGAAVTGGVVAGSAATKKIAEKATVENPQDSMKLDLLQWGLTLAAGLLIVRWVK